MPKKRKKRRSRKRKSNRTSFPLGLYLVIGCLSAGIIWLISIRIPPETVLPTPATLAQATPDPESAITEVAKKLGVTPPRITKTKEKSKQQYRLPIDRDKMDLTYANMIVKSELENRGAKLTSGKAADNKQILTFKQGRKDVEVNLYYDKAPVKAKTNPKYIAIVVDDFGSVQGDLLQGFLSLPAEVTFAIFPGMAHSVQTMEQARGQSRETLIHVPMEPIGYPRVNPGENPILVQMGQNEVEKLLNRHFSELPYCLGINNHMGSLATTDAAVMGHVMKILRDKNKVFLDSRTSNVSIAYQTAQKHHIPAYRNDIFLDAPDISQATMEKKLEQIKNLSASRNYIIAITHCHSHEKLQYLRTFISRLQAEGFTLIPLSQYGKYDVPPIS